MSLEDAIRANTEAVLKHTAALEKFAGAAPSGTSSGTAGTKASTGTGAKATGTAKPKGPTAEDIQTKFGAYMSVTDTDERKERKAHVLNIAGKFGAERATLIPKENWVEALELLAAYEAGNDPFASEDGEGGEEDSPI